MSMTIKVTVRIEICRMRIRLVTSAFYRLQESSFVEQHPKQRRGGAGGNHFKSIVPTTTTTTTTPFFCYLVLTSTQNLIEQSNTIYSKHVLDSHSANVDDDETSLASSLRPKNLASNFFEVLGRFCCGCYTNFETTTYAHRCR